VLTIISPNGNEDPDLRPVANAGVRNREYGRHTMRPGRCGTASANLPQLNSEAQRHGSTNTSDRAISGLSRAR